MADPLATSEEPDWNPLLTVAGRFQIGGKPSSIEVLGNGNVNDTFLVTSRAETELKFVLQRLNTQVFRQPDLVMGNLLVMTGHMGERLRNAPPLERGRRWEVPRVVQARGCPQPWLEEDGNFWRVITFIEDARSFDTIQNPTHAREVGFALGTFHNLISDLPSSRLADTLEGFHITPSYLSHYRKVLAQSTVAPSVEVEFCRTFIREREEFASVLEQAKAEGRLKLRPIHGDPKINNVMIDIHTGQAIGLVDLDTVKPGLVQYDIGDCLRSGCNVLGEETTCWQNVHFDTDTCTEILDGYLCAARPFLTDSDYTYLFDCMRLLAFELGLRFFTDHLAGNVYFKTRHPHQNLARALVQFRLTESIEAQEHSIRSIIDRLRQS